MEVLRRATPRAFRPRKCSESRSGGITGAAVFLIAGNGKPRRGHDKHCPEARNYDGATKNKRAREGPSRTREGHRSCGGRRLAAKRAPGRNRARDHLQRRTLGRRSCGGGQARVFTVARAKACPNLGSSSKTNVETREAQSARQGGTEPGTTRFKDGRATTGPPAPRWGPGAPMVQPRPRGPDLESAHV